MLPFCKTLLSVKYLHYAPGQGSVLHSSVFVSLPSQAFPPLYATTLIVLVEVLVPPAQDLEQLDQGYQGDQEQSTEIIICQDQHLLNKFKIFYFLLLEVWYLDKVLYYILQFFRSHQDSPVHHQKQSVVPFESTFLLPRRMFWNTRTIR